MGTRWGQGSRAATRIGAATTARPTGAATTARPTGAATATSTVRSVRLVRAATAIALSTLLLLGCASTTTTAGPANPGTTALTTEPTTGGTAATTTAPTPASTTAPAPAADPTAPTSTGSWVIDTGLPRADLTPGVVDPHVTQDNIHQTICVAGYSARVRPPTSVTNPIKRRVLAAYAIFDNPANYELDHLISLELGGAPRDERNLWPEPWSRRGARRASKALGAEAKDVVENALHRRVCSGAMTLAEAQHRIATDWRTALG